VSVVRRTPRRMVRTKLVVVSEGEGWIVESDPNEKGDGARSSEGAASVRLLQKGHSALDYTNGGG